MSAKLLKNTCSGCGGDLEFKTTAAAVSCGFCGSSFRIEQHGSSYTLEATKAQNYLELARRALANENGEEALTYSTKALESNPDDAEAWLIKGVGAASIAKAPDAEQRYKESMACLDRAKEIDPTLEGVAEW